MDHCQVFPTKDEPSKRKNTLALVKSLVQRFLAIPSVRFAANRLNLALLWLVSSSSVLSAVFSSFLTGAFLREQQSVCRGRYQYYRRAVSSSVNWGMLRRNTHRLEKGMVLRPRRKVFALEYILETVEEFCRAKTCGGDDSTLRWCEDVLTEYFKIVEAEGSIGKAKTLFEARVCSSEAPAKENSYPSLPYQRLEQTEISYEQFSKLCQIRRSVRYFEARRVPRETLDRALEAAFQAPSACNRQPFSFRVYDDEELVSKIAKIPFGTLGYAEGIPCLIVVTGHLDCFSSPRDRHVIYIDASLASMSLMFALETLGLSSCPINWPDFWPLERKMAKEIGLDLNERPIMLIAVGYPERTALVASSLKKSLEQLRSYNKV